MKRKIAPFIFGITIGLLIGAAFFIFKINDWFTKLRETANDNITVIEQPVKHVEPEPEKKRPPRPKFKINLGKGNEVNYQEVDSIIRQDSRINIATDELLSAKNVKVIKIADNNAEQDSAAVLAEIEQNAAPESMQVEFWKTPLNSRGYRFSKRKLVLYGFPDFSDVLLYQFEKEYFLRASDQVYKLEYTAEFKSPERVTDPELLVKLN